MEKRISFFKSEGTVNVTSSKSVAHRALFSAFIRNEKCEITNLDFSQDVNATISALSSLGGLFSKSENAVTFIKRTTLDNTPILNVGESGSTLRFIIPIALALYNKVIIHGSKRLLERPLNIYEEIFNKQNVKLLKTDDTTLIIEGHLADDDFEIKGNVSSQFITGLVFFKVLNQSKSKITIIPPLFSKNYVDITINVLSSFGYDVSFENNLIRYNGCKEGVYSYFVEKDYSQLAFFAVKAAINGNLEFDGFKEDSFQGDKVIIDILKMVGANISFCEDKIKVSHNELKPFDIDLENCIDLGPIVFVLAAFCNGKSTIRNVERLKIKESDRLSEMKKELEKIGVNFVILNNNVIIEGKNEYYGNYFFEGHNDHRIVMALSVLSSCIHGECIVSGVEAVRKSYENFFIDFMGTGGVIND